MSDTSHGRDWADDPETFGDALEELKDDGCLLLVLESAGSDASRAGCQRMLGEETTEDRRGLFVLTDTDAHAHSGVRSTTHGSTNRAVAYRTTARSAVAATGGASDIPTTTVKTDLDDLATTVEEEVAALAPSDGYEAGELRICLDALDELLSDTDLLDVLQFTKRLRTVVDDANGIAHVHVGTHVPGVAVEGLLSQFDAVVEVADDEDPRQRWHLPDESLSTRWIEL